MHEMWEMMTIRVSLVCLSHNFFGVVYAKAVNILKIHGERKLNENVDRCTNRCDITVIVLKTIVLLSANGFISETIQPFHFVSCFNLFPNDRF